MLEAWLCKHAGKESGVLAQSIVPGSKRTLREFILGKLELFLANHLSKAVLEELLRESARDLGDGAIAPTTMKQFKKLTAYLDGEVTFYAACCRPYDRHAKTCDVCGQDLWIGKRPRHCSLCGA